MLRARNPATHSPLPPGIPEEGREIDCVVVQAGAVVWRVVVRLKQDHAHHFCIECNGTLAAEHVGGLPDSWPDDSFPNEVHAAVAQICEHLSWS